jgi:hypothetical protein
MTNVVKFLEQVLIIQVCTFLNLNRPHNSTIDMKFQGILEFQEFLGIPEFPSKKRRTAIL